MAKMRKWSGYLLAAVLPGTVVWFGMAALARTPKPEPIQNAADYLKYFQPVDREPIGKKGRTIWQPRPAEKTFKFITFASTRKYLALADAKNVCRVTLVQGTLDGCSRFTDLHPDLMNVSRLSAEPGTDAVWVLAKGGTLARLEPASNGSWRVVGSLRVEGLVEEFLWQPDGTLIAGGLFDNELLRRYRAPSNAAEAMALEASGGPVFLSGLSRGLAMPLNQTVIARRPAGDLIAAAFRWADRIRIHGSDLSVIRSIAGPAHTLTTFGIVDGGSTPKFVTVDDSANAYIDITATDDAIIALYSGRYWRTRNVKNLRPYRGRSLHVFSWDGRQGGTVDLDADMSHIEVQQGDLLALAWDENGAPRVEAFELRKLLSDRKR